MSQEQKIPSNEELQKYKKQALVAFLKSRGLPSTGNRDKLLNLAKLYASRPEIISDPEITFKPDNSLPHDSVTTWKNVLVEHPAIPSGFTFEVICSYLSVVTTYLLVNNGEEREPVDVGTLKPVVKGRQIYLSQRLSMAEFGIDSKDNLVFRANCHASLKQDETRFPRVVIGQTGEILKSSCNCPAHSDGKCTHVAALLYCVKDLSFKNTPKISIPSTSANAK